MNDKTKQKITGYHGTKRENVENICTNNFNINEDKNNKLFLGYGIYFFDKYDDAVDWNIKAFIKELSYCPKYKILQEKYSIIESEIEVESDEILDLDEKENLFKLEMLVDKIKGKLITKPEYQRARNKTSAIINMLYKRGKLKKKVIVKTFIETIDMKNLSSFKNYARKMFCVKDVNVIVRNKENTELKEEDFEGIIFFYR